VRHKYILTAVPVQQEQQQLGHVLQTVFLIIAVDSLVADQAELLILSV
jgi:hypothetical protein